MPINILKQNKIANDQIACICDGDWKLPSQIDQLEKWLIEKETILNNGPYVADIGFTIRKGALGGGGVISLELMKILLKLRVEIFLSEYPSDED